MKLDYFDISPEISEHSAVFPGDTAFRRKLQKDYLKGDTYQLSSIETTVHIGAHVDAPVHYDPRGEPIQNRSLDYYFGKCQVISALKYPGRRLPKEAILGIPIEAPRVLFKTDSFPEPDHWREEFSSFSPELIDLLAQKGVILVGIDTPSVDPCDSKVLEAHQALFRNKMANLEGITLKDVSDGLYTLIALPLRIRGGDASPVRAILVRWAGFLEGK